MACPFVHYTLRCAACSFNPSVREPFLNINAPGAPPLTCPECTVQFVYSKIHYMATVGRDKKKHLEGEKRGRMKKRTSGGHISHGAPEGIYEQIASTIKPIRCRETASVFSKLSRMGWHLLWSALSQRPREQRYEAWDPRKRGHSRRIARGRGLHNAPTYSSSRPCPLLVFLLPHFYLHT